MDNIVSVKLDSRYAPTLGGMAVGLRSGAPDHRSGVSTGTIYKVLTAHTSQDT